MVLVLVIVQMYSLSGWGNLQSLITWMSDEQNQRFGTCLISYHFTEKQVQRVELEGYAFQMLQNHLIYMF